MVSFSCSVCQDVVKKPKVITHANQCGTQFYSCVDCSQTFDLESVKNHTSCMTEVDKYQGKWKDKLRQNPNIASGKRAKDSDSDDDEKSKKNGGPEVDSLGRPLKRKKMDLSSSSDDDDWVSAKKSKKAKASNGSSGLHGFLKGNRDASDAELDEDQHAAKSSKSHSAKHVVKTPIASKTNTPKTTPHVREEKSRKRGMSPHPLLPPSMVSGDCIVPSFVLGSAEEVSAVVNGILADDFGGESASSKAIAKKLAERYHVRISKAIRQAVADGVERGVLKADKHGNLVQSS